MQQPLEKSLHSPEVRSLSESELNMSYKLFLCRQGYRLLKAQGEGRHPHPGSLHPSQALSGAPVGEASLRAPVSPIHPHGAGSLSSL